MVNSKSAFELEKNDPNNNRVLGDDYSLNREFLKELSEQYMEKTMSEKIKDALTGDLKRLVKSHELVRLHGGLDAAKKHVDRTVFKLSYQIIELKQAIADVESCAEKENKGMELD